MSETVIRVQHVRKTFRKYKNNFQRLRHMLILSGAGEKNRVLNDVSFEVHKGEKIALFTAAGGGKSTLLRIIAGIIKPEGGSVEVNGDMTLMLDYKLGFDMALSVHDNYMIRAKIMGWTDKMTKEREKEVLRFAGLSQEKKTLFKNLPKGGAARLGFTMSTIDKPDLLLMDEKIMFGNIKLNEKCADRFAELITPEMTLLMAANDFKSNERFCERGIVIHDGRVVFDGLFEEALKFHKENAPHKSSRKAAAAERESVDDDDMDEFM